ncbi:hypothetical protein RN001_004199 [Aquatica leii]|uniref:Non-homologous end-joining factor 1 n=1 Tax=Aquatica leii TaxID=1421715 RepID=A0AAN7Q5K9_9COLE|nr:hypothetical protein RN001_004199 [Aquatica leii]
MWEPVVINNTNYLIKFKHSSQIYLYLSNLKEIWVEQLSQSDLTNRFQELNPLFDSTQLEEGELIQYITSMLQNINDATSIILTENNHVNIELKSKFLESSIRFKLDMEKGDDVMYFNEFTLPLIQSVQYLEMRQKKLFELLEKKDKEIEEHVLENGEITRKVLVTKKFDRDNIMDVVPKDILVGVFGKSKQFFEVFSKNYGVMKFNVKKEGEPVRKKLKTVQ